MSLPEGWRETTLGEEIDYINKKISIDKITLDNYISTENLLPNKSGIVQSSKLPNVEKVNGFIENDVLFSNIRTYFKKVWLSNMVGGVSGDVLVFRPKTKSINNQFLYYLLSSDNFINYTVLTSKGTKMPRGDKDAIKLYPINIPIPEEQKAIANILSSFDEKIELLKEQNETLEEMAQGVFREWFVDGLDENWENGVLSDFATNPRDSISVKNMPDNIKYIGLEHIDKEKITLMRFGDSNIVKSNKYLFKKNDILFGKLRPYFHKVCFAPFEGICSTDILVLRAKKSYYFSYCLFAFYQKGVISHVTKSSEGTRMPRTNWKILGDYPIKVPSDKILKKFHELVISMIKKMEQNIQQIQTLQKTRDTLLPKLMSGELRVEGFV